MKVYGLLFNGKKLFTYYLMLLIGLSLVFGGMLTYYAQERAFDAKISDEEIIERAKDLGMIEIKDKINNGD
jgi:hypothetical protein